MSAPVWTDEQVEKAARAICVANGLNPDARVYGSHAELSKDGQWKSWELEVVSARAALSTVQPAPAQEAVGWKIAGDAIPEIPGYGRVPWAPLVRAIQALLAESGLKWEPDPTYHTGHQFPPVIGNMNSLNRLVTSILDTASPPPPSPSPEQKP